MAYPRTRKMSATSLLYNCAVPRENVFVCVCGGVGGGGEEGRGRVYRQNRVSPGQTVFLIKAVVRSFRYYLTSTTFSTSTLWTYPFSIKRVTG